MSIIWLFGLEYWLFWFLFFEKNYKNINLIVIKIFIHTRQRRPYLNEMERDKLQFVCHIIYHHIFLKYRKIKKKIFKNLVFTLLF